VAEHQSRLLILDNIDAEPALNAVHLLLGRLNGGHVLLTSRLSRFPRGIERLDLDVLSLDAAAEFLLVGTATGRRQAADDADQARALAEELGGLALALEMAAATIEANLSIASYRALWRENRARVIGWIKPEIAGYRGAMAQAWQTSVDQLTAHGRRLLERLAFLATDPVPQFLLDMQVPRADADKNHIIEGRANGDTPPVRSADAENARAALDELLTYSLATRDTNDRTFIVHRLVQDVTRHGLVEIGARTERLTEALRWIDHAFSVDPLDRHLSGSLDLLVEHADAVAAHADAAGIAVPTTGLLNKLGVHLYVRGLYSRAEPLLRRAVALDEALYDKDDWRDAGSLGSLGAVLFSMNRLDEAETLLRRSLAAVEALHGSGHPNVATLLANLAIVLSRKGRFEEAEPLMRRSLAIERGRFGKDNPRVVNTLNRFVELLADTGRLEDANELARHALAIAEASLAKNHPIIADCLEGLAEVLLETNGADEAKSLLHRALSIHEENVGEDHPFLARCLNSLARSLQDTNRIADAEPLLRRALTIQEAKLGKDHKDLVATLNNLARLLKETQQIREAEPLLRRALAICLAFQRDSGYSHRRYDAAAADYCGLLIAMGRSEAETEAALAALHHEAGLS
jgi:tetratricopeptide (TPR) repeat protein